MGGTARRVAIASDRTLVAQVVESALRARGFRPVVLDLDAETGRSPLPAEDVADVGLLVSELSTPSSICAAQATVRASRLPWAVVAGTPRGPAWGAVLAVGAAVVLDSSCSLDRVGEVLGALVDRTFVPDDDLRGELVREWKVDQQERERLGRLVSTLTASERAVLRELHLGHTAAQTAEPQHLTERAVGARVAPLLDKLDLGDQLTAVARVGDLLEVEPGSG